MISGTKISQLPVLSVLQNTDYFPVVRGFTTNRVSGLTVTNAALCAVKQTFPIDYTANTFILSSDNVNFSVNSFNLSGTQVIETSSTTAALRITQTGTGNALVVEDSVNPDSTPVVINNNGQLIVGHAVAPFNDTLQGLHLVSTTTSTPRSNIQILQVGNTEPASRLRIARSRGTISAPIAVIDGDDLGAIAWSGYTTLSGLFFTSQIQSSVDGTPTSNSVPSRLQFTTTAPGTSASTERMCINSSGLVGIGTTAPNELLTVAGNISANNLYGTFLGNANTASQWVTPRNIALSGWIYGNTQIDGTQDVTIFATLSSGVILDSNISNNANISDTKLAPIVSDRKVATTAIDYTGSEPGQVLMSTGSASIWQSLSSSEFAILDGSITTAMLGNFIVTEEKLDTNSVTSTKLSAGSVTQSKLGDAAVTTINISNGSVTLEKTNATPYASPNTLMSRDLSGNLSAVEITAFLNGNARTATAFETSMSIVLTGDLTGQVDFDGSQSVVLTAISIKPEPPSPVWVVYAANILDNLSATYIQGSSTSQSNLITAIQQASGIQIKNDFGTFSQSGSTIQLTITSVNLGQEFTYLTYNLLTGTPLTAMNITGGIVGIGTYTPVPTGSYIINSVVPGFSSTTISISTSVTQQATGTISFNYDEIFFNTPHNFDVGHIVNVAFLTSIPLSTGSVSQTPGLYVVTDVPGSYSFVLSSGTTTQQSASGIALLYRCTLRESYGVSNVTYLSTGNHILNFTNYFNDYFFYGFAGSATSPALTGLFTSSIERVMSKDYQDNRNLTISTILNDGTLKLYDFNRTHVTCFGKPLPPELNF